MLVRDLVAEAIATIAARLPGWAAATGLTLGIATPFIVAQVAKLVAEWVTRIHRFLTGLLNSLANLSPLLARLTDLLSQQRTLLTNLARHDPATLRLADTEGGAPRTPEEYGHGSASAGRDLNLDIARTMGDPQLFDPNTLRGMTQEEVANLIPGEWERRPSKSGGGIVFIDPHNRLFTKKRGVCCDTPVG